MQARLRRWADDTKYAARRHGRHGRVRFSRRASGTSGAAPVALTPSRSRTPPPTSAAVRRTHPTRPVRLRYSGARPGTAAHGWLTLVEVDRDSLPKRTSATPTSSTRSTRSGPATTPATNQPSLGARGMNEQDLYLDTRIALWRVCFLLGGAVLVWSVMGRWPARLHRRADRTGGAWA